VIGGGIGGGLRGGNKTRRVDDGRGGKMILVVRLGVLGTMVVRGLRWIGICCRLIGIKVGHGLVELSRT